MAKIRVFVKCLYSDNLTGFLLSFSVFMVCARLTNMLEAVKEITNWLHLRKPCRCLLSGNISGIACNGWWLAFRSTCKRCCISMQTLLGLSPCWTGSEGQRSPRQKQAHQRISTSTKRSQAEPGECWPAGPGQSLLPEREREMVRFWD